MPKDFDSERQKRVESDREFVIGGETFVLRSGVRPEALAEYEQITADTPAVEAIKAFDGLIVTLLEPGDDAADRWRKLREDESDPITLDDMSELIKWAMEKVTGRPTQQPSPSQRGRGRTGTTLTDASSSPGEKAA